MSLARTLNKNIWAAWGMVIPRLERGHCSLMYHSIGHNGDPFTVTPEAFRRQMEFLSDEELTCRPFSAGGAEREFFVSVTFDDGYLDNLTTAAPILAQYKIPFTVFVVSDFVKNSVTNYLTSSTLKDLAAIPGATIGSHSKSHIDLTALSAMDLKGEMTDSKKYLEDVIGKEVTTMSIPFGLYNNEVIKTADQAGYRFIGTSDYFVNRTDSSLRSRSCIMGGEGIVSFSGKLKGSWDHYKSVKKLLR